MKGNAELATTMERRQCWAFLGQKYSLNTSPDVNLGTLKRELEKTGRADLRDLHQRLLNRTYVLEDCIALGRGEET